MRLKLLFMFLVAVSFAEGIKILGVFHMPSHSHYQVGDKIFKAFAKKGHDVTVISPYAEATPVKNFKTVLLTDMHDDFQKEKVDMFSMINMPAIFGVVIMQFFGAAFAENVLKHPNVQELLKSEEKFDLVIIDKFSNEAFHGFCYHYGTPCIVVSSVAGGSLVNFQMGNPGSPSFVPDLLTGYKSEMSFWERIVSFSFYLLGWMSNELINLPAQNKLVQKYFPGAPQLTDLYYNTSLVLINGNAGLSNPVPLVPNMIEIGGYHIEKPKTLPKNLQNYLDEATDGAIFFSMGSNLKCKDMAPEKLDAILNAFSKLGKVKVLWKFENENLPGIPENVMISKWLPQTDILAHPNVRLFISHGGFLSTIETVHYGVPIVGIPIFGDQKAHVTKAENDGYGIKLNYNELTEETLSLAINEVLNNPRYTENVKKRSQILRDQQVQPIDKAIFWIEYVFRHNGAPHLRTAALSLNWYQYLLLDVITFISLVTFVLLYTLSALIKLLCGKKKNTSNITIKKKN